MRIQRVSETSFVLNFYLTSQKSTFSSRIQVIRNGDRRGEEPFHNREGLLPKDGEYVVSGGNRIVWDKRSDIFYTTTDHYKTFEQWRETACLIIT